MIERIAVESTAVESATVESTAMEGMAVESTAPQWITGLMDTLGAPGAGLAIALENLFPPLPSEVILLLTGFAASTGRLSLPAALLWTTAGSVVGALALYGVGALLGRDRTVAAAARLPLVKVADIERTEAWFARHGTKAVFFGRMIPVFRSLISVPAGVGRMPLPTFLWLTTLGSTLWNTLFVLAGYLLGERWEQVAGYVSLYSSVVLGAAAAALLFFLAVRLRRRPIRDRQPGHAHRDRISHAGTDGADPLGHPGADPLSRPGSGPSPARTRAGSPPPRPLPAPEEQ